MIESLGATGWLTQVALSVKCLLKWYVCVCVLIGEAPGFTESHSRWAQPYRVGIVAMGIRLLFKYVNNHIGLLSVT